MSSLNRDYDDVLRRALHAAAESVEPSPDGLERIRARMSKPPALSFAWGVAWCHEAAAAIGAWAAPLIRMALDAFWSVIDRFRPASAAPGGSGPRYGWIRPVAAMGTAIFVVAAGAFAIMTLPHAISSNDGSAFTTWPWAHSAGPGGSGRNGGLNGTSNSQIAGGIPASGPAGYSSAPSPASSQCSSLGSSRTGTQGSTPPIQTAPASTAPATTPPASSTPTTTASPTTTPSTTPTSIASTTPNPGSENTPSPSTSSQATSVAGQPANDSAAGGNPKEAAVVPSATSSASPCATSPAKKKKKSGQPGTSGDVSAHGAIRLRITESAARHD